MLAALLAAALAHAGDERLPLWRIDGADNHVYLLASVHLLRASDYPLPDAINEAYDDADALVMELDMDDLDPRAMQALVRELGTIPGDGTLAAVLGPRAYARASSLALAADISLAPLAHAEPWYAAITVEQQMLARLHFDAAFGIEARLADRAGKDGKPILGLETIGEQLGLLDDLSPGAQCALLLQSLEEMLDLGDVMDDMVRAWRHGDTAYLEQTLLQDMRQDSELYRRLVVDRNAAWSTTIEQLLDEPENYLVVVGALHLVGSDGLPSMLRKLGREPRQLTESATP